MKTEIINDLNDQINKYPDGIISLHLNRKQAHFIVKALQNDNSNSLSSIVGRNCPYCGEPCIECSHKND